MFNQDNFLKVLDFVSKAHNEQKTPKGLPYLAHIISVTTEIINACEQSKLEQNRTDFTISIALLHDVIEDTEYSYDDLYTKFGPEIADGVEALSKNKNLATKKEQMQDVLEKLLNQPYEVQMVKLADRIVNLDTPPSSWDKQKIEEYHKEAKLIYSCLKNSNIYLSNKLEEKIKEYEKYF